MQLNFYANKVGFTKENAWLFVMCIQYEPELFVLITISYNGNTYLAIIFISIGSLQFLLMSPNLNNVI